MAGATPCCVKICYEVGVSGEEGAEVERGLNWCWLCHFFV